MNCFNHGDRPAVGICKSCGKGLCRECLTELRRGLACKGACESRAELIDQMIDNNIRMVSAARLQVRIGALSSILLGAGLLFLAWWGQREFEEVFMVAMFALPGIVLVFFGLMKLSRRAQYPSIGSSAGDARGGEQ